MKWIKAGRITVALTLVSLGAGQLLASGTRQYERYYYTDATHNVECGQALVFCDGATYQGCYSSPYYETFELPSCTTPGDNPTGGGGYPGPYSGQCADGLDNDNDGKIDGADPRCNTYPYNSEAF